MVLGGRVRSIWILVNYLWRRPFVAPFFLRWLRKNNRAVAALPFYPINSARRAGFQNLFFRKLLLGALPLAPFTLFLGLIFSQFTFF